MSVLRYGKYSFVNSIDRIERLFAKRNDKGWDASCGSWFRGRTELGRYDIEIFKSELRYGYFNHRRNRRSK